MKEISTKRWLLIFIIQIIPVFGIIKMFMWAFGSKAEPTLKNYARANLIMAAIILVIYIAIFAASLAFFTDAIQDANGYTLNDSNEWLTDDGWMNE